MIAITLTTPVDPGPSDPGIVYDKCGILELRVSLVDSSVTFLYMWGTFVNGMFIPGCSPRMPGLITGALYQEIMTVASAGAGEVHTDEITRRCLQWLLDQGLVEGTI